MSPGPVDVTIVPNGVADDVVQQAARANGELFGRLAPDAAARLDKYEIRLHIVPKSKRLTDLAPFRHLTGKQSFESTPERPRSWDDIRGAGGMLSGNTITFAVSEEEITRDAILDPGGGGLLFFPWFGDRFLQLHEGAHVIYDFGLSPEQQASVDQMFDARKADPTARWLKPTSYTSANSEEYFSNSVAAFFGASHANVTDPDYSPDWLRKHDPKMFALLSALFPPAAAQPAKPNQAGKPAAAAVSSRPAWDTLQLEDIPPDLRPQPPPPPPAEPRRRWAIPVALAVVALLVVGGLALAAGGGSDGDDRAGGEDAAVAADGEDRQRRQGGSDAVSATTVPTDPLAAAELPGTLSFTATKTATVIEPPYGIQAVPVGRTFTSTLPITGSCDGGTCTFTSRFATGTGIVRGTVPDVTWTRDGTTWRAALTAHILSNSTAGAECVYRYTDTWDLTVTQAGRRGAQTVATGFTGNLRREAQMDPALSASGIAAGTCLPYAHADDYAITATGA